MSEIENDNTETTTPADTEAETVAEGTPAEPEAAVETPAVGESPTEEAPVGEPVAEVPAVEEPAAEETPAEEPAAEAPPVEEPPAEEAPVEETSPEAPAAAAEAPASAPEAPPAETPAAPPGEPRKKRLKHVPRSMRRRRSNPARPKDQPRKPIVRLEKPERDRGRRQERRGVVVSDAMDKTIVVKVESVRAHQRYKKVIRRSVKFHAHDEQNQAHIGDRVRIVETKPISKTKRWRLAEVLEQAK
jgi:small subunit ribosomal protein S17